MTQSIHITMYRYTSDPAERCPFKVFVNGKKDPRNRDFENAADVRSCYEALQEAGLVKDFTISVLKD